MRVRALGLKLVVLVAVVAAGAWAISANVGRGGGMDMAMRVSGAGAPFPVTVVAAERGPIAGSVTYTGSVAPLNEEDIFPRVTGRIVALPVYPGDLVRAGQVVARLDDVELGSRVAEAEAARAAAVAGRTQMEADLLAAQHGVTQMERELAMVDAELGYAQAVAGRSERLVASGAIARQEYENDRAVAAALEARREAARAKLAQARAMETAARRKVEAAQAMVAQAEAQVRTSTVVRDYVNIVAPSTGYVVKRLVAPGVLVQPGMAILKITQIDRVRLQANVAEKDLASIRVGAPVTVTTAVPGQRPIEARVTSIFPFVESGGRTAVVEAVVDNADRRLVPGQYVSMRITTGTRPDAVSVPRPAVVRLGDAAHVWVADGERASQRPVVLGIENPDRIEIARGLAAGERVVVRGHDGLYAGAPIREALASDAGDRPAAPGGAQGGQQDHSSMPMPAGSEPAKGGKHAGH